MDIPSELVTKPGRQTTYLSDVKEELNTALDQRGYYEKSYYAVPDGFAMATRLEQFLADGVSNSSAILLQPLASLPPLELLRQYNVFLGVLQGLVSGALGAFFVKAERTGG